MISASRIASTFSSKRVTAAGPAPVEQAIRRRAAMASIHDGQLAVSLPHRRSAPFRRMPQSAAARRRRPVARLDQASRWQPLQRRSGPVPMSPSNLVPDRLHRVDPGLRAVRRQFADRRRRHRGCSGGCRLPVAATSALASLVTSSTILRNWSRTSGVRPFEPFGRGDQQVGQKLVVGLGDAVLHLEELLGVDVRPGVFLTIDNAGLQRAIDFLEGQLLGRAAHGLDHRNGHVGGLDAELQAVGVGRHQQRLVGRELLQARRPVAEAGIAVVFDRVQQVLAGVADGRSVSTASRLANRNGRSNRRYFSV